MVQNLVRSGLLTTLSVPAREMVGLSLVNAFHLYNLVDGEYFTGCSRIFKYPGITYLVLLSTKEEAVKIIKRLVENIEETTRLLTEPHRYRSTFTYSGVHLGLILPPDSLPNNPLRPPSHQNTLLDTYPFNR